MKLRKKLWGLLLVICLIAGLAPQAAATALAQGNGGGKAEILLPDANQSLAIEGVQTDNVYFGNYAQSDSSGATKEPVRWRVLSNSSGKLFLLSDWNLDVQLYHNTDIDISWKECSLRDWLNNTFYNTAFAGKEQGAIAETIVINEGNPDEGVPGSDDTNDHIFLLSIAEVRDAAYGFAEDSKRIAGNTAYAINQGAYSAPGTVNGSWWLRSPGESDNFAVDVSYDGIVATDGGPVNDVGVAVRPVLNLNLGTVLFASAADGSKSSASVSADAISKIGTNSQNEWKLTLKDSSRQFKVSETNVTGSPGATITLNYSNATIYDGTNAPNEYISVIIADNTDKNALYYGRVKQPTTAGGTVDVKIPADLADGNYILKVFSEQCNGDKKTDYSSVFSNVALTVDSSAPPLYSITANPAALSFDNAAAGYAEPAAKEVTIKNTGSQSAVVNLPASANYNIVPGAGFADGKAVLTAGGTAVFAVSPKSGLAPGNYNEALKIEGINGASAEVSLTFAVTAGGDVPQTGITGPDKTIKQTKIDSGRAPKTGDVTDMPLYFALLISSFGLCVLMVSKKKRRHKEGMK